PIDPSTLLRPTRQPLAMSAVLLPFTSTGDVDWRGFRAHVGRTAAAGLMPAVNMDTGYGNLLDDKLRRRVLAETRTRLGNGPFAAGAFCRESARASYHVDASRRAVPLDHEYNALLVILPSPGFVGQPPLL